MPRAIDSSVTLPKPITSSPVPGELRVGNWWARVRIASVLLAPAAAAHPPAALPSLAPCGALPKYLSRFQ